MARTKKRKKLSEQVEDVSMKPVVPSRVPKAEISLSSPMFNLMCSDHSNVGGSMGTFVNIVGDKATGKTFVAMTIFADAHHNPKLDGYTFIHDNVEDINLFDMEYLFGPGVEERIQEPSHDRRSSTVQDFQRNLLAAVEEGPCIYILDSFDALKDADEDGKWRKKISGQKTPGTYGMGKAKSMSEMFRNLHELISDTNSLLVIISQTRANIGDMFEPRTRSGGAALDFYAALIIWLHQAGKIKKKERQIGSRVKARCKKNKITGKIRDCRFDIYYDYGIDSIGSCVDFLFTDHWTTTRKAKTSPLVADAEELDIVGTRDKIIRHVEENDLEDVLFKIAETAWLTVEESLRLNRKRKYR